MSWLNLDSLAIFAAGFFAGYLLGRLRPTQSEIGPEALDALIGKLGGTQRAAVARALRNRNKIEAIRLFREATNTGLYEAKKAVERMASR